MVSEHSSEFLSQIFSHIFFPETLPKESSVMVTNLSETSTLSFHLKLLIVLVMLALQELFPLD